MRLILRQFWLPFLLVFSFVQPGLAGSGKISIQQAHKLALEGKLVLVDIRTPGEWRETGIGASAKPISMHKPKFLQKLTAAIGNDKSKSIALICATGSRSRWLQSQLAAYGYSNILDASEGMLGNRLGPGWIARGLPVKPYKT
ncbi:MAG: rhodanese-like domain-containing protein [Gammaproteobacteria bacterium]|nr:rhodanese-like domain-containing protein [Gammaproteobacteria bacterium]